MEFWITFSSKNSNEMNDLMSKVSPKTRGIIWLPANLKDSSHPNYQGLDYLLDGLLTAHIQTTAELTSRLIIGKNFNKDIYVLVIEKFVPSEFKSFEALILTKLTEEDDILVIDDQGAFETLSKHASKLTSHFKHIG
jgi:hypothetical protein